MDRVLQQLNEGFPYYRTSPSSVQRSDRYQFELLEYDTARATVWTIQQLARELNRLGTPLPASAELLTSRLGVNDDGQPEVATLLPATQEKRIFRDFVESDLLRRASYDPRMLAKQLAMLKSILDGFPSPSSPQ